MILRLDGKQYLQEIFANFIQPYQKFYVIFLFSERVNKRISIDC